jgi:hypothetical protein
MILPLHPGLLGFFLDKNSEFLGLNNDFRVSIASVRHAVDVLGQEY